MKKASLALALFCFCPLLGTAAQAPAGFTPLFNGQDLAGWHGLGDFDPRKLSAMSAEERAQKRETAPADLRQHWRVENGEVVNDGQGVYLTTDREYGDMELLLEYKTVERADSGIYLRGNPQVQIWDYTDSGKWQFGSDKGSGGLWNNSPGAPGKDPLRLADKPFGEWNSFRIVQVGERVTIYLNDQLVVNHARMENYWDRQSPLWPQGPIQLQTHGGEIRWRNLFIREIGPEEANVILRRHHTEDFHAAFAGEDFRGWAGPTANYDLVNGVLSCQAGRGGTIYTTKVYADFIARMEIKLPPGGNNGLAIRYPGSGDTAYVGLCELQVLDDSAPKYKNLDPRQFHGSAYGMVAAHRGFQRPPGQWNFQEVTVRGSQVRVELNGTRILDTDLSQVTTYLDDKAHPGKSRSSGHFGFAGHGDPVQFRNVELQCLE